LLIVGDGPLRNEVEETLRLGSYGLWASCHCHRCWRHSGSS
jgi:hypothetical protein